jgi:hypothetical protein
LEEKFDLLRKEVCNDAEHGDGGGDICMCDNAYSILDWSGRAQQEHLTECLRPGAPSLMYSCRDAGKDRCSFVKADHRCVLDSGSLDA